MTILIFIICVVAIIFTIGLAKAISMARSLQELFDTASVKEGTSTQRKIYLTAVNQPGQTNTKLDKRLGQFASHIR